MVGSKVLNEIVLMRPICIICIIIGHAFAAYSGAWVVPNIQFIDIYKYVNPFFISFQLAAFVYISGYLFESHCIKIRQSSITDYVKKKAKRLLLPCYILSCVYILLFERNNWNMISFLNGSGHLWFLPMLFWCYLWLFLYRKYIRGISKCNIFDAIWLVLLSLFLYKLKIPFGISSSFYYFPFMYMGCLVYNYKEYFSQSSLKRLLLVVAFTYSLLVYYVLIKDSSVFMLFIMKYFICIFGTLTLWLICFLLKNNIGHIWINLNKRSYGMYLLHQFVLIILYYYCSAFALPILLPFIYLLITLFLSYSMISLLLNTKLGKYIS